MNKQEAIEAVLTIELQYIPNIVNLVVNGKETYYDDVEKKRLTGMAVGLKSYLLAGNETDTIISLINESESFKPLGNVGMYEYDEVIKDIRRLTMKEIEERKNQFSQEAEEKPKATEAPQRTIDEEGLKDYFSAPFKGMGNGNINHFKTLIDELKTNRSAKEFAQIALMIYDSGKMNDRKPNTFSGWCSIFCKCIGCERKTYKPNQLKPFPKILISLFSYL